MMQRRLVVITLAAASAVVINVQPAAAKIACSNGFQIVQGSRLATPYCQDELVAQVARQYGVRASADHIRNNPNFKRHVCRLVGQDIRIKESCEEVTPSGRGRF